HVACVLPLEPAVPLHVPSHLVDRHEDRQLLRRREREVFGAAAGSDVHHPCPLGLAYVLPGDDAVTGHAFARRVKLLVERPAVAQADELATFKSLEHRRGTAESGSERPSRENEHFVTDPRAHIVQVWVHRDRDVRSERPRCRGPHKKRLVLSAFDWKPDEDGLVRYL